jgi:hypothetical protein
MAPCPGNAGGSVDAGLSVSLWGGLKATCGLQMALEDAIEGPSHCKSP